MNLNSFIFTVVSNDIVEMKYDICIVFVPFVLQCPKIDLMKKLTFMLNPVD